MFVSEWREFPSAPCLAGKETWWQLASPFCWNRARPWHASELVSFLVWLRTYHYPRHNYYFLVFFSWDNCSKFWTRWRCSKHKLAVLSLIISNKMSLKLKKSISDLKYMFDSLLHIFFSFQNMFCVCPQLESHARDMPRNAWESSCKMSRTCCFLTKIETDHQFSFKFYILNPKRIHQPFVETLQQYRRTVTAIWCCARTANPSKNN